MSEPTAEEVIGAAAQGLLDARRALAQVQAMPQGEEKDRLARQIYDGGQEIHRSLLGWCEVSDKATWLLTEWDATISEMRELL